MHRLSDIDHLSITHIRNVTQFFSSDAGVSVADEERTHLRVTTSSNANTGRVANASGGAKPDEKIQVSIFQYCLDAFTG